MGAHAESFTQIPYMGRNMCMGAHAESFLHGEETCVWEPTLKVVVCVGSSLCTFEAGMGNPSCFRVMCQVPWAGRSPRISGWLSELLSQGRRG